MKFKFIVLTGLVFHAFESMGLDSFSYSGRLVNSNGSPVTGPVTLKFDLSSTEDSSDTLCSKTVSDVSLSQGIFNVKLDFLPADCENHTIQSIMESIPSGHSLTYQVTDLTNSRSYSHQTIYSVPSSFMASFAKSLGSMGATTDGQVLKWSAAAGKWIPGSVGTGNGTLTSIITGSGLAGGPIENSGTIFIAPGGVQDSHLASGIDPAKLAGTRDSSKYLKGDSTWSSFEADLLGTLLNNFSVPTPATAISSGDTVLEAFGKLQGQIEDLDTSKLGNTGGTLIVGTIDGVPDPTMPGQIVNKEYVDNLVVNIDSSQWTTATPHIHYNDGNVGIGTSTPVSILDIQSVNSGILIPRMTELQRDAIILPAGMQIYNTITNRINFHDGTSWKELGVSGSGVQSISTGTGIVSTTITDTGTIAVDVGTSSGKIPQLDGSGKLPTTVETDPTVSSFAKSSLPTCGAGEVLSSNGTSFNCATDANSILTTDDSSLATSGSVIRIKAQGILDTHLSGLTTGCGAGQILATNGLGSFFCADRYWGLEPDNIFSLDAVAIGGNTASASAVLDLQSSTKGFLPPRMSTAERNAISAPTNGLVIYNTSSNQIEFFNGTGWSTSNTFVGARVTSDVVQAGSLADTKLNMNAKTFDVGNNFDLATDRFQPTVAGKYLVTLQIHASSQTDGAHNISTIYKNGSMYERRFTRSTGSGNSQSTIVTLVDMNGTTDYIEPYFSLSAGNADAVTFTASLQSPGSSSGGGGGAVTSNSVDGTHIQDGTITSADIAPNTISVSNLDFASNEGINLPQQAANPATGIAGQTYFNTTTKTLMFHDGTSWQAVGTGGGGGGSSSIKTDSWNSGSNAINTQSITLDTASVVVISASIEATHGNGVMEYNGARVNISTNGNLCGIDQDYVGADTNRMIHASASCVVNLPAGTHTLRSELTANNVTSRQYNKLSYVAIPLNLAGGGGAEADNLGNHTATQNIKLGANWISGDGDSEGISINSNGNVGIGTISPGSRLQIGDSTSTNSNVSIYASDAINKGVVFGTDTTNRWSIGQYGYDGVNPLSRHFYLFEDHSGVGGSTGTRMVVAPGGNVGIGTSSPGANLQVGHATKNGLILLGGSPFENAGNGSGYASIGSVQSSSNLALGSNVVTKYSADTTEHAKLRVAAGTNSGFSAQEFKKNGEIRFYGQSGNTIVDTVANTDAFTKMIIDSVGNVGIGTITPSAKLDVAGNIKASGDICSAGGATCMSTLASGSSKWSLNGANIYRNSNVGIGTATPQGNGLHINSSSAWTGTKYTTAGTGTTESDGVRFGYDDAFGGFIWNREATGLIIATNDIERLRVDSSGNVGIGTITPSTKFDVVGGIKASGDICSAGGATCMSTLASGSSKWSLNGSDIYRNSKVGVGTSTPGVKLHLLTNDSSSQLRLEGTGTYNAWMEYRPSDVGAENWNTGADVNGFKIHNQTDNTTRLLIDNNGNVGIGTNNPPHKLTVQGNHLITTNDYVHGVLGSALWLARGAATGNTHSLIQAYHDGAMTYAPLVLNPSGGNVGIGTTEPDSKLHINTSGNTAADGITLRNGTNQTHKWYLPSNTHSEFLIGSTAGLFSWKNSNGELLRINSNGNVGIGTISPVAKLQVEYPMNNGASKYSWQSGSGLLINNPSFANGGEVAKIVMNTASGGYNSGAIIHVEGAGAHNSGQLVFSTGWDAAGNATERMRIKNDGNVGVGTTAPSAKIHAQINETGSGFKLTDSAAPNGFLSIGEAGSAANTFAPMIMGRPSGSDKMTGLYSDVLSAEDVGSVPALILLGSKASGVLTTRPVLGINNHTTRLMTVLANGSVGIGTNAPAGPLHITSTRPSVRLEDTDGKDYEIFSNGSGFSIDEAGVASRLYISSTGNIGIGTDAPSYKLQVGIAGDGSQARANAWNALSDEKLKKNFKPIPDALEKIKAMSGYYYEWKRGADKSRKVGVKAQEVQKVFPEVVSKGDDGFLSVSYDHLIAPLIEAVKSLSETKADQRDVESLKIENERLKKENEEIKTRLRRIEESLNLR